MGAKTRKIPTKVQTVQALRVNVSKANDYINNRQANPSSLSTYDELYEAHFRLQNEHDQAINLLKVIITLLAPILEFFLGKTSKNSHKNPAADPNRDKNLAKKKDAETDKSKKRNRGGQKGHQGHTLKQFEDPDEIISLKVNRDSLIGDGWTSNGVEKRQVVDFTIKRRVVEYQAEILTSKDGQKVVADFPEGVNSPVQYGETVKAAAVYMSVAQLIPFGRVVDCFKHLADIVISPGSVFNFKGEAHKRLQDFQKWVKFKLGNTTEAVNVDETGVNIGGIRKWLHVATDSLRALIAPHDKRGAEAMKDIGVIPHVKTVLVHDHWVPYFSFTNCLHALCGAHILRELQGIFDDYGQKWPILMIDFLANLNLWTTHFGGVLSEELQKLAREDYRKILELAEKECPEEPKPPGKKGRPKKTKARNLLERLARHEDDILRFMSDHRVPFTNNAAENAIRMSKVQQKISGCFRSFEGAEQYCLIRSYILTCQKNGVKAFDALKMLFSGCLPSFIDLTEIERD
jgi:transposase